MRSTSISFFVQPQPPMPIPRNLSSPLAGRKYLPEAGQRMARGLVLLFLLPGFTAVSLRAQTGGTPPDIVPTRQDYGTINGRVTDPVHGALRGARIELQPRGLIAVSENEGQFTIPGVPPGTYTLTISYIRFAPFSTPITVTPGGENEVDALLHIGSV